MNDELLEVVSEPRAEHVAAFTVTLSGELDAANAAHFRSALDALVDQGARLLVIDGSALRFIDSSGLRVLVAVAACRRCAADRGAARRSEPVLELAGLLEHYTRPAT